MNPIFRTPGARVIAVVLVLQTIWLRVLGIAIPFQLGVLAIAGVAAWVGWAMIRPLAGRIDDGPARAALAYLAGVSVLTMTATFLFQRTVEDALGLSRPVAAWIAVGVAATVAGWIWSRRSRRIHPAPRTSGRTWSWLLGAALVMSALTIHGVGIDLTIHGVGVETEDEWSALEAEGYVLSEPGTLPGIAFPQPDSESPSWGRKGDYLVHVMALPRSIVQDGLPDSGQVAHRGLPVWTLVTSLPANPDGDPIDPFRAAKVLAVGVWGALLALARWILRGLFGVSERVAWVGVVCVTLFSPINVPLFQVALSPYRGFLNSSASMYHNLTQVYAVALGFAAVSLMGSSLSKPIARSPLVAGAAFLTVSAWFKPSIFLVLAPPVAGMLLWVFRHDRVASLTAGASLALPAAGWLVYPSLVGAERYGLGARFDPLGGYEGLVAERFPSFVLSSDWTLAGALLLVAFAAWVIPVASLLARIVRRGSGSDVADRGQPGAVSVILVLALVIGIAIAFLFDAKGGNMKWPASAAYVLAIPVLIKLITEIRSHRWRTAAWAVVAVHVWGGVLVLARITMFETW